MNAKNPSDITRNMSTDISLMYDRCRDAPQRNKLKRGERTNRMDGIPMMRCNLSGKGKTAAPAIDTE
jgi:hypothetical protein